MHAACLVHCRALESYTNFCCWTRAFRLAVATLTLFISHCAQSQMSAELACRCFEGALAALAAPLVGYLAEHVFGLHGTAAPTGDPSVDLPKARALGSALLILTAVPWTLCLLLYSGGACMAKTDMLITVRP